MKIKILAVPSIIALIIIMSIWMIYPAYSNGSTGVLDNYHKLKVEETNLADIHGKSGNSSALYSQIEAMPNEKAVLYAFIPENIKESELLDNLNKMAVDSGLLVSLIDINQPEIAFVESMAPVTMGTSMDPSIDSVLVPVGGQAVANALPNANPFKTNINAIGTYDQIKIFLSKVNEFSRYSDVSGLSIKKQIDANLTDNAKQEFDAAALSATFNLEFDILKKAKISSGNVNDPIFSGGSIDTQTIAKIKDQFNNKALILDAGQKGKSDIFMP